MDNFQINVFGDTKEQLRSCFDIALFGLTAPSWLVGFVDHDIHGLVLYWTDSEAAVAPGFQKFAVVMRSESLTNLVWEWLQTKKPKEQSPDLDGSVDKGFHFTNGRPKCAPI